jgi:hypothetical protein
MWVCGDAGRMYAGTARCQGSELHAERSCTLKDSRSPRRPRPGTINTVQILLYVARYVAVEHVVELDLGNCD